MTDLPTGWAEAALDDIADVVLGQSPPGSSYNTSATGTPFFQGKAEFGELYPTVAKWTTEPRKLASRGDILLSVRAPVGPTNLAPEDCAVGRGLHAIHPLPGIDRDYLLWAIRATVHVLAREATGSTFEAVSGKQVKAHSVPIAPSAEQRRIVEALEDHLTRIDAAEGSLEKARARLQAFRRTLLAQAFDHDWPLFDLGDVAEVKGGIQKQPKRKPVSNAYPFLRVANVYRNHLELDDVHEIELFDGELERYRLEPGDLLVVEGNGSPTQIGRSSRWDGEIAVCVHQNHLIRIRPGDTVDPAFLNYFWNSPTTSALLMRVSSSTSGLHTLSTGKLKAVPVPVPEPEVQRQVVRRIDAFESRTAALATDLDSAETRSAMLRRSVLAEAFAGRLVPQDPDDEPAETLLERIQAERAAQKPKKRARKKVAK